MITSYGDPGLEFSVVFEWSASRQGHHYGFCPGDRCLSVLDWAKGDPSWPTHGKTWQ